MSPPDAVPPAPARPPVPADAALAVKVLKVVLPPVALSAIYVAPELPPPTQRTQIALQFAGVVYVPEPEVNTWTVCAIEVSPVPPEATGKALASVTTWEVLIVTAVVAAPPAVVVCKANAPVLSAVVLIPALPLDTPLSLRIVLAII
jgi:hypothetical protein